MARFCIGLAAPRRALEFVGAGRLLQGSSWGRCAGAEYRGCPWTLSAAFETIAWLSEPGDQNPRCRSCVCARHLKVLHALTHAVVVRELARRNVRAWALATLCRQHVA